jgi:hypothetical protein
MDPEELQRQLAELMTVVKEERKLRQAANAARIQSEARLAEAAAATPASSTITTTARGPKIAVPDKFDGSCGTKAEVYGSQVRLYVVSNPALFPDDLSKVVFALSYLTGSAIHSAGLYRRRSHLQRVHRSLPGYVL